MIADKVTNIMYDFENIDNIENNPYRELFGGDKTKLCTLSDEVKL